EGPRGAGRAADEPRRGAGRAARPGPPPAAAHPAGRPRPPGRLPAPLPRVGADRRRTAARVLVDARGAGRPGGTRRRPVLGRRAGPPRDPAVADGRLGLRPLPPGPGPALAALRAPVAADLGRTPRGHLAPRGGRVRLLQQRPGRRGGRRRGGLRPYGAG